MNAPFTCFNDILVLIENLLDCVGIDVDVVVLDQVLQSVVVVQHSALVVISKKQIVCAGKI